MVLIETKLKKEDLTWGKKVRRPSKKVLESLERIGSTRAQQPGVTHRNKASPEMSSPIFFLRNGRENIKVGREPVEL